MVGFLVGNVAAAVVGIPTDARAGFVAVAGAGLCARAEAAASAAVVVVVGAAAGLGQRLGCVQRLDEGLIEERSSGEGKT